MALIKTLRYDDLPSIKSHFLSMDPDTLYSRFMCTVTPSYLDRYMAGFDFEKDILLGIEDLEDFSLIGLAEIRPVNEHTAEVAFTVSKNKQKHGFGRELVKRAFLAAKNKGYTHVNLVCMPENKGMQHIAKLNGMTLEKIDGDVHGEISLPDPDIYSRSEELGAEIAANLASVSTKLLVRDIERFADMSRLVYTPVYSVFDIFNAPLFK